MSKELPEKWDSGEMIECCYKWRRRWEEMIRHCYRDGEFNFCPECGRELYKVKDYYYPPEVRKDWEGR